MTCLCARTRRTARLLTRCYEDRLRPLGLTVAQFELLSELAGRPDRPQAELAGELGLDQTTLSRNLKATAGYGWVAALPFDTDRRQVRYALTAKGRERLRLAVPEWRAAHDAVRERMGADWGLALGMLDRVARAVSS